MLLLIVLFARGGIDGLLGEPAPWLSRCSQIDGLTKRFGGVVASDDIALDVPRGRAARHHRPERRRQDHADRPAHRRDRARRRPHPLRRRATSRALPAYRRSALGLARSFQITSLFLDFTALDNVALAVQAHAGHSFRFWRDARGETGAARAGARGARARRPRPTAPTSIVANLSHGEHRQLEIAMALATRPRMLLLDEPMAGHGAGGIARAWSQLLRELKRELTDPADRARHGGGVRARRPHHRAGLRPRHRHRRARRRSAPTRRCARPISASRRR